MPRWISFSSRASVSAVGFQSDAPSLRKAIGVKAGGAGKAGAADLAGGDDGFEPLDQGRAHDRAYITLQCDEKKEQTCSYCDRGGEHPIDIAREHVNFDIELSPGAISPSVVCCAVWGMMLTEKWVVPSSASRTSLTVSDTPSSAIEPFGAIIGAERARHADADARRIAFGTDADDLGDRIDMAGDDMAAELVAQAQRALEVELRAFAPQVGGGPRDGFGRNIDREPVVALVDDGQADARAGDRRAEIDGVEVVAGPDRRAAGRRAARRCGRCRRR